MFISTASSASGDPVNLRDPSGLKAAGSPRTTISNSFSTPNLSFSGGDSLLNVPASLSGSAGFTPLGGVSTVGFTTPASSNTFPTARQINSAFLNSSRSLTLTGGFGTEPATVFNQNAFPTQTITLGGDTRQVSYFDNNTNKTLSARDVGVFDSRGAPTFESINDFSTRDGQVVPRFTTGDHTARIRSLLAIGPEPSGLELGLTAASGPIGNGVSLVARGAAGVASRVATTATARVGQVLNTPLTLGRGAPARTGSFGGVTGTTAAERSFLNNAQATFGDGSVFTSATRHRGNLVIQRSDIPLSIQNLRRMQSGNSPFVRNAAGEWETLNVHHVGRRDGKLIEVFNSHNTYNPATGGPLHIPGAGGPVRQPGLPQTYWQQRFDDFIGSGQVSDDLLRQLGR